MTATIYQRSSALHQDPQADFTALLSQLLAARARYEDLRSQGADADLLITARSRLHDLRAQVAQLRST